MFDDEEQIFNGRERLTFDPWALQSDHQDHIQSTSIVELDDSGRVFCPICLENIPQRVIEDIENSDYNKYINKLFEALNENNDDEKLRGVLLPLLEKLLRNRPIDVSSDHSLHNILRIIYKIMRCYNFNLRDFPNLASIFSIIAARINLDSVPMVSIWITAKNFLDCANNRVSNKAKNFDKNECKFLGSLIMIVKTFLSISRQFSVGRASDLIFPLVERRFQEFNDRKYQKTSQSDCLKFLKDYLLPRIWSQLKTKDCPLDMDEKSMIGFFFDAIDECFQTAIRLDEEEFLDSLMENDCLSVAHNVIYRNPEIAFRAHIRKFLHRYVGHYIEKYLGADSIFKKFMAADNIVETNHQNARVFCNDKSRYTRTIFYLLVNFIACKQQSKFYIPIRVKKVLKIVEPISLHIGSSVTLTRAYLSVAAAIGPESWSYDNLASFVKYIWKNYDKSLIDEIFCFENMIFRWVYERPGFLSVVTGKTVKYLLESQTDNRFLIHNLRLLLKSRHYKNQVQSYVRDDNSASITFSRVLNCNTDNKTKFRITDSEHFSLVNDIAAILLSSLHKSLLESINNFNQLQPQYRTFRILEIILNLIKQCRHFVIVLDDQFTEDLFKFIDKLYRESPSEEHDRFLSILNDFMSHIMRENNPNMMNLLKHLEHSVLGLMLSRLADYTKDDHYVESVARLVLSYDNIDYPLINDVRLKLGFMSLSSVNWMLSPIEDLHILTFRVIEILFEREPNKTNRICIAVALIQMLSNNPELLGDPIHTRAFKSILKYDEIAHNPLLLMTYERLPREARESIDKRLLNETCPSPTPSFGSAGSSVFEEEHTAVTQILTQLHQDDRAVNNDSICRFPPSLFMSSFVRDPHTIAIETNDWEKIANEGNINEDFTPL